MSHRIYIVAPEGDCHGSVIAALDLFKACNRIAARLGGQAVDQPPLFTPILIAAKDSQSNTNASSDSPARDSAHFTLNADGTLSDIEAGGSIYLTSPMLGTGVEINGFLQKNQTLTNYLRGHGKDSSLLASHCSGCFLLAEAGLLAGGQATTAWYLASEFRQRYPDVTLNEKQLISAYNNILCAGARSAGNDLVLTIIERLAGRHYARLLAKYMLLDNQREHQAAYEVLSEITIDDSVVASARQWIRKNLAADFCIDDIAEHVDVSSRTLIRRFRNSINETPQSLTQKLRIEKSKVLLETTQLSLHEIILRVGYSDERAFRRLFNRLVCLTPNEYRQRFNTSSEQQLAGVQPSLVEAATE